MAQIRPVMMPWDIATAVIPSISVVVSVVVFVASFVVVSAAAYADKDIWRADTHIHPSLRQAKKHR